MFRFDSNGFGEKAVGFSYPAIESARNVPFSHELKLQKLTNSGTLASELLETLLDIRHVELWKVGKGGGNGI
jgi:hypothetical protein